MVLKLNQNTQILHYLQQKNLDRLIINDFDDKETIITNTEEGNIELIEEGIIYDNSFKITDADNIVFKFNKILFNKFDELRIILESVTPIDLNNLECFLSISKSGELKTIPTLLTNPKELDNEKVYELIFTFDRTDDSKYLNDLANVQSIILDFDNHVSFNIHNITILTKKYDTTLEMFEEAHIEATNYIGEWITSPDIEADSVQDAIIKLTAINLWLIENQTHTRSISGEMGKKNYYDQLMIQVENIIRKFNPDYDKTETKSEEGKSKININLLGSV